ncbi:MAG: hypothetical protein V1896_03045 [Candidatus Zambryskibacteria bacterium]
MEGLEQFTAPTPEEQPQIEANAEKYKEARKYLRKFLLTEIQRNWKDYIKKLCQLQTSLGYHQNQLLII